ncbi:hypothetical protein MKY14_08100 [Paenibacillus sp. FSL R5-0887]|uniref:hypothetical protein n=1 Tax=Paenibacillus sp. FSL R5-0887 TaxID=2921662 RepID=UPI0030F7472E
MNDIAKIGDYWYITSTTNFSGNSSPMIIRLTNLNQLEFGRYENIYELLGFSDIPFFISEFGGKVYITEIGNRYNGFLSFDVNDISLSNVYKNVEFEGALSESIKRKSIYPR